MYINLHLIKSSLNAYLKYLFKLKKNIPLNGKKTSLRELFKVQVFFSQVSNLHGYRRNAGSLVYNSKHSFRVRALRFQLQLHPCGPVIVETWTPNKLLCDKHILIIVF